MDNPTVVILTDPTTCQIGQAETLLQALLQIQLISKETVSDSQAFCDHPAAAMQFIDAYAKAFPDLQQQLSGLPLPEYLYSMVADGRFGPLPAPVMSEVAKNADDARSLQPLYVLSLGVPEALMQALQHNGLAHSKIRVLEIAPVQQAKAEAVSVAEAVAPEPVAAWLTDTSSTQHENGDDALAAGVLPTNDPLTLASVEVNLDRIHIDHQERDHDQGQDDAPSPAVIAANVAPTSPVPINPGAAPQAQTTELAAVGATMVDPTPPAAPVATPPAMTSATEPDTVVPPGPSDAYPPPNAGAGPPSTPPTNADSGATPPAGAQSDAPPPEAPAAGSTPSPPADDDGPGSDHQDETGTQGPLDALPDVPPKEPDVPPEEPDVAPEEPDATTGTSGDAPTLGAAEPDDASAITEPSADEPSGSSEESSSSADAQAVGEPHDVDQQVDSTSKHPAEETSVGEEADEQVVAVGVEVGGRSCSFDRPGEDVRYQPAGSLARGEDLIYVPPADLLPEGSILDGFLESSDWTEVVDLGALHDELPGAREAVTAKAFDFIHMPPPATDGHPASRPPLNDSARHDVGSLPDDDAPYDPDLPALHDDF